MLEIRKKQDGDTLNVALIGRLDTVTSPQLEGELRVAVNDVKTLIFDLADLEYVSSAGLRVFLSAQKVMNRQGEMKVRHIRPGIMEILEVTGFIDLLDIEE
ncbi:MAG: STAS domain-containing protein [Coriobacteriales bacterium]|nr:STAS domain-containing protein [Coriobacteriales bacterium]